MNRQEYLDEIKEKLLGLSEEDIDDERILKLLKKNNFKFEEAFEDLFT